MNNNWHEQWIQAFEQIDTKTIVQGKSHENMIMEIYLLNQI